MENGQPCRIEVKGWRSADGRFPIVPVVGGYRLVDFRYRSDDQKGYWQQTFPSQAGAERAAQDRSVTHDPSGICPRA